MSKVFKFSAKITVSTYTEVEADSLEEATRLIQNRGVEIGGFGGDASESWMIDDADGEPVDIILDGEPS